MKNLVSEEIATAELNMSAEQFQEKVREYND